MRRKDAKETHIFFSGLRNRREKHLLFSCRNKVKALSSMRIRRRSSYSNV